MVDIRNDKQNQNNEKQYKLELILLKIRGIVLVFILLLGHCWLLLLVLLLKECLLFEFIKMTTLSLACVCVNLLLLFNWFLGDWWIFSFADVNVLHSSNSKIFELNATCELFSNRQKEYKKDEQINESVESTMNDTLMYECVLDAFVLYLALSIFDWNWFIVVAVVIDMVAAITCV